MWWRLATALLLALLGLAVAVIAGCSGESMSPAEQQAREALAELSAPGEGLEWFCEDVDEFAGGDIAQYAVSESANRTEATGLVLVYEKEC
jgi:hypothetical protein